MSLRKRKACALLRATACGGRADSVRAERGDDSFFLMIATQDARAWRPTHRPCPRVWRVYYACTPRKSTVYTAYTLHAQLSRGAVAG